MINLWLIFLFFKWIITRLSFNLWKFHLLYLYSLHQVEEIVFPWWKNLPWLQGKAYFFIFGECLSVSGFVEFFYCYFGFYWCGRCIFLFNKIVNIEAVVVVVKEGKSDGWIQSSSSSSGRKCEDAALPCSHFVEARKS